MNSNSTIDTVTDSFESELELRHDERKVKLRLLWIFACFVCPSLIDAVTGTNEGVQITVENWQRVYVTKMLFLVALPLITAFALAFSVKWKSKLLALSLIICLTAVPTASSYWTAADLIDGTITEGGRYESSYDGINYSCWLQSDRRHYVPCRGLNVPDNTQITITFLPNTQRVIKVVE